MDQLPAEGGSIAAAIATMARKVPGVDFKTGLERYGSESAFLAVLRSYATHTASLLEKLEASSEMSLPNYAIAVHGLKGASKGILAKEVGQMAEKLEAAAHAGDLETIIAENGRLLDAARRLMGDLNAFFAQCSNEVGKRKELRPSPEPQILEKIKDAAKRFKTSLLEEYISEMENYEYSSGSELVSWLRQSLDELEYDNIVKRLEESE
jgi:HPt (histidine-containing phosphotransfer) domain-containing protein